PPDAPRVAPHAAVGRGPRDVTREVLAPALGGEDAQRARELLRNGQLPADAGPGTRLAHALTLPSKTSPVTVLVIGATGELGAGVARALVDLGVDVRAMTRSGNPDVDGLTSVVRADLSDPASLADAFAGVQRAFLVSSPTRDQVELETNAIAAAEAAGLEHV